MPRHNVRHGAPRTQLTLQGEVTFGESAQRTAASTKAVCETSTASIAVHRSAGKRANTLMEEPISSAFA